ncbi:MAG TPA: amidohydrolase family protein [Terriglobales bacterium]|nr:amidohydrolase family protein [Terriglobales bacterium]
MRRFCATIAVVVMSLPAFGQTYDVVIRGGRVLDPETGLDAVRDVGINGSKVVAISPDSLTGSRTIDAHGLVVAPGFIDLHQHGQDLESQRLKAFDGVTTALELEIGTPDVAAFLHSHQGTSLINYGSSASHVAARATEFNVPLRGAENIPTSGPAGNTVASLDQVLSIESRLEKEIAAGALGVGMGLQYTPGATRSEVIHIFGVAARHHLPIYVHVRSAGRVEPGSAIESIGEVIGAAAVTGAPLHIVHLNSICLKDTLECLEMVAGARARGLDVTTEAYPYAAAMTLINSPVFSAGWQERFEISYAQLMLPNTGERLTKERFEQLHNSSEPRGVIIFNNTEEMDDAAIVNPLVMIASDGIPGHPRNAGTYSRVLARYVRSQHSLTLMDAVRKMTLMPAQRLEAATSEARKLGRLQQEATADIVVFDPAQIRDRSTFSAPNQSSAGVRYLLVGGVLVIENGTLVPNLHPGRAITSIPGNR